MLIPVSLGEQVSDAVMSASAVLASAIFFNRPRVAGAVLQSPL